jgi:hypothetical protein
MTPSRMHVLVHMNRRLDVHALNLSRGQCHMDLRPVIEDPRASGHSPPLLRTIYALPGRP